MSENNIIIYKLSTMPEPCFIHRIFYYDCGHMLSSRQCNNMECIWKSGKYHNPQAACNEKCLMLETPPNLRHLRCTFCRQRSTGIAPRSVESRFLDVDFISAAFRNKLRDSWDVELLKAMRKQDKVNLHR